VSQQDARKASTAEAGKGRNKHLRDTTRGQQAKQRRGGAPRPVQVFSAKLRLHAFTFGCRHAWTHIQGANPRAAASREQAGALEVPPPGEVPLPRRQHAPRAHDEDGLAPRGADVLVAPPALLQVLLVLPRSWWGRGRGRDARTRAHGCGCRARQDQRKPEEMFRVRGFEPGR